MNYLSNLRRDETRVVKTSTLGSIEEGPSIAQLPFFTGTHSSFHLTRVLAINKAAGRCSLS